MSHDWRNLPAAAIEEVWKKLKKVGKEKQAIKKAYNLFQEDPENIFVLIHFLLVCK